jgi:hypothetical protein
MAGRVRDLWGTAPGGVCVEKKIEMQSPLPPAPPPHTANLPPAPARLRLPPYASASSSLGTMFMAWSSWNSSLQAYGRGRVAIASGDRVVGQTGALAVRPSW